MNIKIFDNFLNEEDFEALCSLVLKKEVTNNKLSVYHNMIDNQKIIKAECIDEKVLYRLHKNYHNKAINILNELNPKKVNLYDYSEFLICETGYNYKFPIHDDVPKKLLSGVIYIKPEKNIGTKFYKNKKGDEEKEIEWKQNRGVFFAREERQTWHSFEGDGKSNRIVLIYNLMTNKIKEVNKIENKNYFFSQIRNKINPYLHRFFKFNI